VRVTTLCISDAQEQALRMYSVDAAIDMLPYTLAGRRMSFTDVDATLEEVIDAANSADNSGDFAWCNVLTRLAARVRAAAAE